MKAHIHMTRNVVCADENAHRHSRCKELVTHNKPHHDRFYIPLQI